MSTSEAFRALVIGAGYMGRHHLDAYAELPHGAVVGAVSRSEATAESVAAEYDVPTFTDVDAALTATRPSLVSVCSPTQWHAAHARAALGAGAHVLVEKPLTATIDEGRALVATASAAGRVLMVAHTTLFEPPLLALIRQVQARVLGPVVSIRFERTGRDVSPGEEEKGRAPSTGTAVGRDDEEGTEWLYDHLVHVASALNRLAASVPARVSVAERCASRWNERLHARIQYGSGAQAEILLSSEADAPFAKRLTVTARDGELEWRMRQGTAELRRRRTGGRWEAVQVPTGSGFRGVVRHFVSSVVGGRTPMERGEDGLRAMALAAALAGALPG